MKLSTNVSIAIFVLALNIFGVDTLIHSEIALKWIHALIGFVNGAQVIIAANSNPDGTPASTLPVTASVYNLKEPTK